MKDNKIKISSHESYITLTLLAILVPWIGIILGIVYLAKEDKLDKRLGEHLVAISILFGIIETIAWVIYTGSIAQPLYPVSY